MNAENLYYLLVKMRTCAKCSWKAFHLIFFSAKFARCFHNLMEVHPQHARYMLQVDLQKYSSLSIPLMLWKSFFLPIDCWSETEAWLLKISSILRNAKILGTHSGCLGMNFILNAFLTYFMLCNSLNLKLVNVDCSWLPWEYLLKLSVGGGASAVLEYFLSNR